MTNILDRFRASADRTQGGPEAEEIKALSDQFRVTLSAAVDKIEASGKSCTRLERTKELLTKESWRWKDAYEVEQQVVLYYDSATLRTELLRRTLEAKSVLYPDVAAWYGEQVKEASTIDQQRALLLRLVNDLQWRYTVNEAKLGYAKQITGRTGSIFIYAVLIFIAFLFLFLYVPPASDPRVDGETLKLPTQFLTFLLAAVSGYLGASFSMVASLKTRLESSSINQMKNASSRAILFSRVLVGTGAAMILYFFFLSGLLQGAAFPELSNSSIGQNALLVVWSFIAGFSEKLVPGLLAKTEAQLSEQPQTAPHSPISNEAPVSAEQPAPPAEQPAASDAATTATADPAATAGVSKDKS